MINLGGLSSRFHIFKLWKKWYRTLGWKIITKSSHNKQRLFSSPSCFSPPFSSVLRGYLIYFAALVCRVDDSGNLYLLEFIILALSFSSFPTCFSTMWVEIVWSFGGSLFQTIPAFIFADIFHGLRI